ncbi:MAG: PilZ domain-containing protein [Thermodesulfobacteriota bacterium]
MDTVSRRKSQRIPFRKRVRFGADSLKYMGHSMNFSLHGMVIESAKLYSPGSKILIEIVDNLNEQTDDTSPSVAMGTVVWTTKGLGHMQGGKMGIQFSKTSAPLKNFYKSRVNE